jgi:hypothetical protein
VSEPIRGFHCGECGEEATCSPFSRGYRYECTACEWYDEDYTDGDGFYEPGIDGIFDMIPEGMQ